jgi:hypothetical protein
VFQVLVVVVRFLLLQALGLSLLPVVLDPVLDLVVPVRVDLVVLSLLVRGLLVPVLDQVVQVNPVVLLVPAQEVLLDPQVVPEVLLLVQVVLHN